MVILAYGLERRSAEAETEGPLHFFARELQTLLRWTVRALVLVTLVFMAVPALFMWAIAPATILIITYGLFLLVCAVEKHSARRMHRLMKDSIEAGEVNQRSAEMVISEPVPGHAAPSETPAGVETITATPESASVQPSEPTGFKASVVKRETIIVTLFVLSLFVVSLVIAVVAVGWELLLVAAPMLFAYILLLGWPVWFAAIEEDIEAHPDGSR